MYEPNFKQVFCGFCRGCDGDFYADCAINFGSVPFHSDGRIYGLAIKSEGYQTEASRRGEDLQRSREIFFKKEHENVWHDDRSFCGHPFGALTGCHYLGTPERVTPGKLRNGGHLCGAGLVYPGECQQF